MINISRKLFFLVAACLPINLGYHFIVKEAYAGGLLIDYLIPTLFIQDLLVLALIISWSLSSSFKEDWKKIITFPQVVLAIWFVFAMLLSVFESGRTLPSLVFFARTALYVLFMFYTATNFNFDRDFGLLTKIFTVSVFLLGLLGVAQYLHQGSIFDNYLVFGEQPYDSRIVSIAKENVFGYTKIPAYGLFRHPNIFGGILSILLIWIFQKYLQTRSKSLLFVFLTGIFALVVTFSYLSWASLVIGIILVFSKQHGKKAAMLFVIAILVAGFLMPSVRNKLVNENPSVYRRINLLNASYKIISSEVLFGVGINNSIVALEKNIPWSKDIRFVQPVHNIFVLVLLEMGLVGFLLFVLILGYVFLQMWQNNSFLYIALLQIIFLGSFDHYFVTIHQPWLLLWLIIGMCASLGSVSKTSRF